MACMNVDSNLSKERVCESELRQSIDCNGELANANKADAELRNGDDPAGKLTNRNRTLGRVAFIGCYRPMDANDFDLPSGVSPVTHLRDHGFTTKFTTWRVLKPVLGSVRGSG
jgi:hypothetical protein